MPGTRSAGATLGWLCVLFLMGAAVTVAAFAVFIPGPERGMTFYVALSIVVAAELVFFAHLAHSKLADAGGPTVSSATRIQVQVLIFIWFVLSVIGAVLAADPDHADTAYADRVLAIYLILTFVFFAVSYFVYAKDIEVERVDRQLIEERRAVQLAVPDIEQVMRAVGNLGDDHAEHAILADRVYKKLDSFRTAVEGAFVSERALDREGEDWNAKLEQQVGELVALSGKAPDATAENASALLREISEKADAMLTTLRRREQALMSGGT